MTARILRATALAALILTSACATAPGSQPRTAPTATAFDAAGTYTFTSQYSGQTFEGVIRLARSEAGAYTGTLTTPLTGALPVRSVDVQGSRVRVTAQGQMGDAVLTMEMSGDAFSGQWAYGPASGQMTGRMSPAS